MDAPVLGVQRVVLRDGGGNVDPGAAQVLSRLLSWHLVDLGGDDGTAGPAKVVNRNAGQLGELAAELLAAAAGQLGQRRIGGGRARSLPRGRFRSTFWAYVHDDSRANGPMVKHGKTLIIGLVQRSGQG